MRILYDGEIYSMQTAGGINRYFASLISRLPASFAPTLLVARSCGVNAPVHPRLTIYGRQKIDLRSVSCRFDDYYSQVRRWYLRTIADSRIFDLAHPTYYQLVTRRDLSNYRCPIVLTVWDMTHELFQNEMDPEGAVVQLKRKAIQAADVLVCISENTKNDLLERYRVAENKVKVIPLASDINFGFSNGPEPVPSKPYYLYVGSRSSYKNFDGLCAAFAKAVTVHPELMLCVVGALFNKAEQRLIYDFKLTSHVEHYGYATDEHLAKLYRHSIGLVYPSFYEGFGLPPLEAMSCGTAVIAANVASIPEVVGEAGLLFDPASTDELADSLLFLLNKPGERERLIAEGHKRAKAFSWDKTVAATLEIYRQVSESSGFQSEEQKAQLSVKK